MQRARFQAMGERAILSLCIFTNRLEYWRNVQPNDPSCATPNVQLRRVTPKPGVRILKVWYGAGPTERPLNDASPPRIDFTTLGQARLSGSGQFDNVRLDAVNTNLPTAHPDYDYRIDLTVFTGMVAVREK
jgi:hypothetical protein